MNGVWMGQGWRVAQRVVIYGQLGGAVRDSRAHVTIVAMLDTDMSI